MSAGPTMSCWRCSYVFESWTGVGTRRHRPESGSVSICLACGALGIFVDAGFGLVIREPTTAELDELLHDSMILGLLAARTEAAERYDWAHRRGVVNQGEPHDRS